MKEELNSVLVYLQYDLANHFPVAWEDKCCHSEHPPSSFFFPPLYMLSIMPYGMEYPFGQLGSAVPAVSPSRFLCTPSLLAGGMV